MCVQSSGITKAPVRAPAITYAPWVSYGFAQGELPHRADGGLPYCLFSSTRRIIVPNLIIPCVKRYERALYNRQQNKRCAYGSGAAVETLRVTESTLLLRCRVVGVQSRLFIARRQTDSRVIATVNLTADTLVLIRTPAAVRPTLRRTRGVGSN